MGFSTSPLYPDSGTADALKINGTPVSGLKPANGQTLVYSSSIDEYVPQTPSGGGGGGGGGAPDAHAATHATGGTDPITPGSIGAAAVGALDSKLNLAESSYIIAKPGDDLAAQYTAAKALAPNGAAKSATNRASLVILPGRYTLTAELAIDAEFVDLIGLGAQTRTPAVLIAGNTLNVSANDVRVSGVSVGTQSFKITGDKPLQFFENCAGGASSFGGGALISTASGTFIDCSGGVDSFGGVGVASGIFANCRLTTGSFPTIYIPGKMRSCLDVDYNVFDADGIYDPDASSYFTTAGVTDNTAKQQIHAFVLGIKQLGLWSSMVCWPLRSSQNAGTGSTAYSLGGLGTYNGTLVNGPTWGADGIVFVRTSSQYINAPTATASPSSYLIGAVINPSTSGTDPASLTIAHNGTGNADAFQIGDASSNILTGGHRQVAGSTVISPANQTYTTGSFQFVQQGWDGATVRRFFNKSSEVTAASNAFGGFISPLRINARGDSVSQFGNNKTTSFAFMTHGSGASATISNSIFDLYKSTLGQGLGLP